MRRSRFDVYEIDGPADPDDWSAWWEAVATLGWAFLLGVFAGLCLFA